MKNKDPQIPDENVQHHSDESESTIAMRPKAGQPTQIGPYQILGLLGTGGMGEVYLAEQKAPIKRRVALKLIKVGMDTKEVIARFESERQTLALMNHPNIAQIHDAGSTDAGRPYFVMEHVPGEPITDYCDRHRLDLRSRLELFIPVCLAIQHAHQKGIIHRDIKPSNVLVAIEDDHPVPKVIDFGVAKATQLALSEKTIYTMQGRLIGTPAYMSPEQAEMTGLNIDTTSDVYSLGVLLYEILVGALPFEEKYLREAGIAEIHRIIRDEDPPKPSTKISSLGLVAIDIAHKRGLAPKTWRKQIHGELDWIIMHAMEKDRTSRYPSASELSADVQRYLQNEPIRVGPPSLRYQVTKFFRRNRVLVIASMVVLLAIFGGIIGTTTGMIRANQAERVASREATTLREVTEFLISIFDVANPDSSWGETITAREILDSGSHKLNDEGVIQPQARAQLKRAIGMVYQNLGLYDSAAEQLETALELTRNTGVHGDLSYAESLAAMGGLHLKQERYESAVAYLNQAWTLMEPRVNEADSRAANLFHNLASVYRRQGHYDIAEPLYQRAKDIRLAVFGPLHPEVGRSYNSLAILNWNTGDYKEAEKFYRLSLSVYERVYGDEHAEVAKLQNNLAILSHHFDRLEEAELLYRRAVTIYKKTLGPEHPRLGIALNNLGLVNFELERYDTADTHYNQALSIRRRALGEDHPDVAQTLNNLANLMRARRRFSEAETLYTQSLSIRRLALGKDHPDVGWSLRDMGLLRRDQGNFPVALNLFGQAVEIFEKAMGIDHPDLMDVFPDYVELLRVSGNAAAADSLERRLVALEESTR